MHAGFRNPNTIKRNQAAAVIICRILQMLHSFIPYRYAAVIAGVLLVFLLPACENDPAAVNDINAKKTGVEEAKNVIVNYTLGGRAKAVLRAPLMFRVQDTLPYVEFTKTVHVDFYNDSASIDSKLDAVYAKYTETQSRVFLKDSVKMMNINGDTLYCDELYWDRNRQGREFYTDKPVRIRTRTHIINGIGMESSQDFKEKNIRQVTGIIKVSGTQFPQ
jgi:LPS export ABC transporter protein LptC